IASRIWSTDSASHHRSLCGRPNFFSNGNSSECRFRSSPSITPVPYSTMPSGRRIARVGKERFALLFSFLVQFLKAILVHVNFAAHFEKLRSMARQFVRHGANGFDVLRDIVAHESVAARGAVF